MMQKIIIKKKIVVQILALLLKTYQRRVTGNIQISKPLFKERNFLLAYGLTWLYNLLACIRNSSMK